MSEQIKKDKPLTNTGLKPARERGVGNPESHSQDADRHRKTEHPKSDK